MEKIYVVYNDDWPISAWLDKEKAEAEANKLNHESDNDYYFYEVEELDIQK